MALCLQSIARQKVLPNEIIIADDGSAHPTADLIKSFQKKISVEIKHVWHADEGFRLAAIRNKAIAASSFEYIIQIDGDLILHPYFVADHMTIKKEGYFVAGSRVMLSQETTLNLIKHNSADVKRHGIFQFNTNAFRSSLLRNFLASRYKCKGKYRFYVKGCNMAFFKKDLIKVNGYNEAFSGWGSEDREIAIRLINAGIKKQFLKNSGICYHLYHHSSSKEKELKNENLMIRAIKMKSAWTDDGLNKYLNS